MSTNIHFNATRNIVVCKTGKNDTQTVYFNQWQTPTEVTRKIMNSMDPIQAYKDWILSKSCDEEVEVYAEDDYFQERAPVGKEIYNAGKEHIAAFEQWLADCEEDGYVVTPEAW